MMKRLISTYSRISVTLCLLALGNFVALAQGTALITDKTQFSSNASDEEQGLDFDALKDNDVSTFWTSDWHGRTAEEHYLQVDLKSSVRGYLNLVTRNRSTYNGEVPTKLKIKASLNGTDWTTIEESLSLQTSAAGAESTVSFYLPSVYRYLRFTTVANNNNGQISGGRYILNFAEFQLYSLSDPIRNQLSSLKLGENYVTMKITNMPGGGDYYIGSDFRPTTEKTTISIYKEADGSLYLMNGDRNRMTYYIYGDMFRDAINRDRFYKRGDWSTTYSIPQMQYLCGANSFDQSVEQSPYITVSGSEHDLEWGTGHDGNSWQMALGDELWPQTYTPYNYDTYNDHWLNGTKDYFHFDIGTNRWEKYDPSTNTWNVRLKGGINQDWKAMLYLKPNLSVDIDNGLDYTFSCTITSDRDITNVIVKFQDSSDNSNNMFEIKIPKIKGGEPYYFNTENHYMSKAALPKDQNNAELVISFGGTPGESTESINVDISNISLKPVTRQGTWGRQARRFCQIDIDNENYLRFILKDDMLQNNSGPMNKTNSGVVDENIFYNKGIDWAYPLYFIADKTNEATPKDYLRVGVSTTNAVKVEIDTYYTYDFKHYVGDVYNKEIRDNIFGSDIPDNLIYTGGDYKTHSDDGRILPTADVIQRTHEYEREVWVFPGHDYELMPYSDFKTATQYEEKYIRWYDYSTGRKNSHIYPDGQRMVEVPEGLIGFRPQGDPSPRDYATHMLYRVGDDTTNNIWPAHPAMTHIYTPGGVDFSAFSYPEITSATLTNEDDSNPTIFSKGGDEHITVTFNDNNKHKIYIDQHPTYQNGTDYLLTLKVKSSVDMTGVELYPLEKQYINSKGETIQGFDKNPEVFKLKAGEEKVLEYRYSEGPNNLTRIWFDNVVSQDGATFEIYDIIIKESKTKQEPLSIEQRANSYKFTVTQTNERWRAIVDFRGLDIDIDKQSDYTFRCTINSSAALKIKPGSKTNGVQDGGIFVKIEDVTDGGNFLFDRIVEIEESEVGIDKEVEITVLQAEAINLKKTDNKWKLLFDFGSNPSATIEIKDIVLLEHTTTENAELLDIIAMDASCSFDMATDIVESGNKTTIHEPNLSFRNIFVIRNAKLRADIMSVKSKNESYKDSEGNKVIGYVDSHRESLLAPAGTPFQYRMHSGERFGFPNDYETEYWYKTGADTYAPVHHYLIETWKDGVKIGSTINFEDGGNYLGDKPSNIDKLAQMHKANNKIDRVFYIKSPEVGNYEIKIYAIENNLSTDESKKGVAKAIPIYYYGESHTDDNRMLLMAYDLTILGPKDGNMILEDQLNDPANDALYAHQRPAKMVELYGAPTTEVNFDDLDLTKCQLVNGDGFYRWPRKWEDSSYGFPYNPGMYDYNMYVVSNKSSSTHYHEAAGDDARDRAYIESGGKKKGFFYYTNAAGDPGRMTVLNIGKDFCAQSTVYVSAWVMEFSKTYETANVVFSFKGVDANGYETTLSSFVTGYVTGGNNTLDGYINNAPINATTNPDNRGKWHHVYYSFQPNNPSGKVFDHYIISVENNCVSSSGADYAIDDIRAFVCKPAVYARQSVPICNGDKSTNLILTAQYDQIMDAFAFERPDAEKDGKSKQFDYCFVDKAKYDEGMKYYKSLTNDEDRIACYKKAFGDALIHNAYGPTLKDYGVLDFNTWFDSNAGYNPEAYYDPDADDASTFLNKATKYTDAETGKKFLVFPSYASDSEMEVGKQYIVAMYQHTGSTPTAMNFRIDDACSSSSEFTVITSGQVKIDGELASAQNGANVCANQIPVITIDMSGIGNLGTVQKTENAYFDWYKGPLDEAGTEYNKEAPDYITTENGTCSPRFTWVTNDKGDVVITISKGEGEEGETKFRNNGMNGIFKLNGNEADFNTYFNRGKKDDYTYTLTLKDPANKPANGSKISYSGQIECRSNLHVNDWSNYEFIGYTYGTDETESYHKARYNGTTLHEALGYFREYYPFAKESEFKDKAIDGSYLQKHKDCIQHFLDEEKISLYKNSEFLSTYDEYQHVLGPDEKKKYYITALPINPTPTSKVLKYCLDPFQIVLNLSTRTPRMKNGDDGGLIPYPADMRDVPLRIGLRQLNRVRINDLNDKNPEHFLFMPLRDVEPATTGVDEFSLIQKADDDYVYLMASNDPDITGGTLVDTGNDDFKSDVRIIGKVSDIKAQLGTGHGNVCHLAFLSDFKFREGYEYTIKFKFEENYKGVIGDHSDVCPGDVVCTIKVVPEYQMWTGAVDSNWNNDGNWRRVSTDDLLDRLPGTPLWDNATAGVSGYSNEAARNNITYDSGTGTFTLNVVADHNGPEDDIKLLLQPGKTSIKGYDYSFAGRIVSDKDIDNVKIYFELEGGHLLRTVSTNLKAGNSFSFDESDITVTLENPANIYIHFALGWAKQDTHVTISDLSIEQFSPGSNHSSYVTDGGENDTPSSYVPADFTKVIIPANVMNVPKLHNLRRSENMIEVHFAGAQATCNFLKNMAAPTAIKAATEDIEFHMSSIDNTDGNVACRSWYDHTCQYIHFNSEAQMLSQQYLHYEKAWADFEMEPNKWTTISSPLINVVSGDLYLPKATARQDTPLFKDITFDPNLHDRFHPAVFQRTWNAANAKVMHPDGHQTSSMVDLDWSQVYNDGNVNYTAGVGFAIKPDVSMMADKPAKVKFRLPKADVTYHYWKPEHGDGAAADEVVSLTERTHKLADLSDVYAQPVVQNGQKTTNYYLIGNPMMCYINMKEFFESNPNLDRKYWIVTGQGQQYAEMDENTAGYVGTVENTYIAPFQSFFVRIKDDPAINNDGTFTPKFESDMMVAKVFKDSGNGPRETFETMDDDYGNDYKRDEQDNVIIPGNNGFNPDGSRKEDQTVDPGTTPGTTNPDESPSEEESDKGNGGSNEVDDYDNPNNGTPAKPYLLNITATDGNNNTSSVILTDGVERQTSGVEALFDSNLRMSGYPMLYTTKNHEAMSLTQILPGDTIPVALSNVRGEVTLKIKGADTFETPLYLIDATTGETVPLTNDVVLTQKENGVKYYIAAEPTEIEDVPTSGLPQIITEGNTLIVKAPADAEIDYIKIYKIDGITVATDEHVGDTFTITLPHNVYIIDIVCNGHRQTVKISM